MNKNIKIILISICVLLAISLLFGALYIIRLDIVSKDEDKQVEVLCQIFESFLKEYNDYNIVIDESTLKNFKTNEKFNDKNIAKLKEYEKNMPEANESYTLSITTSPYVNVVNLMLKSNNSSKAYQQQFSIKPGLFKITFKSRPTSTIVN